MFIENNIEISLDPFGVVSCFEYVIYKHLIPPGLKALSELT